MKNLLLGIIAINLTFISANLYLRSVEPVQAEMTTGKTIVAVKIALGQCMTYSQYGLGGEDRKGYAEGRYDYIRCD